MEIYGINPKKSSIDLWWRDPWLSTQCPKIFKIVSAMLLYFTILDSCFSFLAWNANFYWNLIDLEMEELELIMSSLTFVYLSSFFPDKRVWSLNSFGLFFVKSFFSTLFKPSIWALTSYKLHLEL